MRNEVDKKLNKLKESDKNNGTQKVPKYQMGNAKISAIRNLQEVSAEYTKIMAELSKYCETVMGYPPCKFSVVGMARKKITPYSDFEHIIVLENDTKTRLDYKRILNYFRWFTVIFHIVVINLQETIIPSVDIESLKRFFDRDATWGVSFDGMCPMHVSFY